MMSDLLLISGPEPGLTRDCVRDGIHFDGWDVELMDTAGWIRRTRFSNFDECNGKVTLVSQLKSKEAMKFTHVVVLVVDAAQALGKDVVRASYIDPGWSKV